jgi:hypothetical protein
MNTTTEATPAVMKRISNHATGEIVITHGVHAWMKDNEARENFILNCACCFAVHQWGCVGEDSITLNKEALQGDGCNLMGAYVIPDGLRSSDAGSFTDLDSKVWIITDGYGTPSIRTTVLFPSEY